MVAVGEHWTAGQAEWQYRQGFSGVFKVGGWGGRAGRMLASLTASLRSFLQSYESEYLLSHWRQETDPYLSVAGAATNEFQMFQMFPAMLHLSCVKLSELLYLCSLVSSLYFPQSCCKKLS